MLQVSQATKDKINTSEAYSMSGGCWLEYNMNDLINGAKVRGPNGTDENPEGDLQITQTVSSTGKQYYPYKKLFPLTNIIDPRRPLTAGVSYFLLNQMAPVAIPKYNVSKELPTRLYFASAKNQYKYFLAGPASNLSLTNCNINVEYPAAQTAVANTIVVKFETSYSKPSTWSIKIKNYANVEATISTNAVVQQNGLVQLYYNGGLWSSASSWSTTKFSTPSAPVDIKNITVSVSTIDKANSYLGVIEVGARYIQDVTDRVTSFQISKMSSDSSSGIVPVGSVTANAMSLSLEGFDKKGVEYDKTVAFNKSNINLYKNVKALPFHKIGSDMIFQGVFYIDSFAISEFGEIDIQGLDGAKFLQETLAPDIVIQNAPYQAIIRRLLDSIGFTSYNFNTYNKDSTDLTDTATIVPLFWYTEDTKTVWEHIQDLCRDTQMIATFDADDVLQFYPRDYLFDKARGSNFKFRSEKKLLNLPNIISLNKETVPSVKAVKVIYSPIISTNYSGSSDNLYVSPPSAIGAAALQKTLTATPPIELVDAPLGVMSLAPISAYSSLADTSFYNKSGYFLINNEIIKYDAIEFQYEPISAPNTIVKKWITSDSDIAKWLGESKIGTFKATLRYRIKERNSFNATGKGVGVGESHEVSIDSLKNEWSGSKMNFSTNTVIPDQSVFSLKETDSSGQNVSRSLLRIVTPPKSPQYYAASITPTASTVDISTEKYFSVGTALFFKFVTDSFGRITGEQSVSAGLGIGISSTPYVPAIPTSGINGYMLKISTSQNVANKGLNHRDVQMFKVINGVQKALQDSQTAEDNSITGVSGGKFYRIDVRVSRETAGSLKFKIKFNNQIITITDSDPIAISNKISLIGIEGESSFDYAYASALKKDEFNSATSYDNYASDIWAARSLQNLFGYFILTGYNSDNRALCIK